MAGQAPWVPQEEEARPITTDDGPDKRSGYCPRTRIYHSLFELGPRHRVPTDPLLHTAKFVVSQFPHRDLAHTKLALIDSATDLRLTYAELRSRVSFLAAGLHHGLGVRKGDVLLLLAPNSCLYPVVSLAVLSLGAVLTTANPLNTAPEIAKQILDSGAKLAVASPDQLPKLSPTGIPIILTHHPTDDRDRWVRVEDLIAGGEPLDEERLPEIRQSDMAALLYSSGTTGVSKGVMLTHGNLISIVALMKWTVEVAASPDDVVLAFLPMFHIYGLAFFALGLFATGTTVVTMPRFDLQAMLRAVERYGISNIPAVPLVILAMAKSGAAAGPQYDLSSLRRVSSGAAPLSESVASLFRKRYPWVELRQGYGLTETSGAATFFVSEKEAKSRPWSVGGLLPGFEAKVVEVGSGDAAGPGREGELWLRSGTVMKGYLGREAATEEAVNREGWLRTGDLCYMDQDGFMYIVDRIKELIKHKGYQVAPAELEALLLTHPDILDAAVVPAEDEEAGQIPVALVVKRAGSELRQEEVVEFVGRQVAPYKKVKRVSFIDVIPRSAAGKILRKVLVAQIKQQQPLSKL